MIYFFNKKSAATKRAMNKITIIIINKLLEPVATGELILEKSKPANEFICEFLVSGLSVLNTNTTYLMS